MESSLNINPFKGTAHPVQDWKPVLEKVVRRIQDLSNRTEKDFLLIGNRLQDFRRRSEEISKIAVAASSIMSGDEIRGAVEGLKGMINQLETLFREADEASGKNLHGLAAVGRTLRDVRDELQELRNTSRDLKMLALSTKIQSTRIGRGQGVFMQLGNDIAGMSEVIHSRSSDLSGETSRLAGFVAEVTNNLRELKVRQKKTTGGVLRGTHNIVESLGELSVRSGEEVRKIKASAQVVTTSIQSLVTSIQYQDITRQAMDRIRGELKELQDGGSARGGMREVAGREGLSVGLTGACIGLIRQSRSLEETGYRVSRSMEDIMEGLRTIADNIAQMGIITAEASRETARFLEQLEVGTSSVTTFLSEVVESSREMSDALSSLAGSVEGMSSYSQEIEMITSDVELISLNARIMSAQAESGGAGLTVIAGAVQETANESENKRRTLLEKLQEISRSSVDLKKDIEETVKGKERELDQVVRELGVFLDALRIMQNRIVAMLKEIDAFRQDLHQDITQTLHQVHVQDVIESEVEGITDKLDTLVREMVSLLNPLERSGFDPQRLTPESAAKLSEGEILEVIKRMVSLEPGGVTDPSPGDGEPDEEVILF